MRASKRKEKEKIVKRTKNPFSSDATKNEKQKRQDKQTLVKG